MSDPRPPAVPWLTPYLTVVDAVRSLDFYVRAFGFAIKDTVIDDDAIQHAELTYKEQLVLMFAPEGAYGGTRRAPVTLGIDMPASFYLYVDDVDAFHDHAVANGAKSIMVPDNTFWGDRYCQLEDLDGYNWGIAGRLVDG